MHRFYFHLSNHTKLDDEKTEACCTVDDARDYARKIATELARVKRKESRGLFIRVTDQNGKEVFRTAVAKAWREVHA
jgi:hypothetical protein